MPAPADHHTQGLTITKKILLPFLAILIILGLAAAIGSMRLISNAFVRQVDSELLAAKDMIQREVKEQEALLGTFADMLLASHFTLPDQTRIDNSIETMELGEGNLSIKVVSAEDQRVLARPQLQQLLTLARRSAKQQLRVLNDADGVPTLTMVQPVPEASDQFLVLNSHLDREFLAELTEPLGINAQIISLDNRTLVSTTDDNPTQLELTDEEFREILSGGLIFRDDERGREARYLFCAIPLGTTDLIVLAINRAMANQQQAVTSLATHSAATVLFILLVGGYIFFLIVRRVMQPLDTLLEATRRISAGQLDHRAEVDSKDEFGILGSSFNAMVSELNKLYEQKMEQEKTLAHAKEELKYKHLLEAKNSEIERTNQELRVHLKEMSALFNLNQAMASSLEIGVLFDRMISVLRDLLQCNQIMLFTYNQGNEELVARKSYGFDQEIMHNMTFRLDEGITGKVALTQELLYVPDLESDGRSLSYKGRGQSKGSLISVPLTIKNRLSGVLNLHKDQVNAFSASDLKLVQAVANQAAVAIENSQLYEKARELSNTDELTGLANRRHFQLILKRETAQAQRYHSHFSLIMADIDNFKAYNDTHGHLKGDILLKKISQILLQNTRGIDLVARFGGEEFVILLPKTETEGAKAAAEKLRINVMAEKFQGIEESHKEGKLTISLGVAEYPKDSKDIYELLDLADRALYRAKHEGKNRVIAWSEHPSPQREAE